MRILAPRKRDSVSGEEVAVAVARAVAASSERYNGSSSSENHSSGTTIIISGGEGALFDLPGKLNGIGIGRANSALISTTSYLEKSKRKKGGNSAGNRFGHQNKKKSCEAKRVKVISSSSPTKSPCAWRSRAIGKSVTLLSGLLDTFCCVAWKERKVSEGKRQSREPKEKILKKGEAEAVVDVKVCSIATPILTPEVSNKSSCVEGGIDVTGKPNSSGDQLTLSGTANSKIMRSGIYHEKQVKSLCALHALNNLLQDGKAFKQEDLDKICSELDPNSWVNPHKSVFGLGNYDINVIMTALQQKKLEAIWFDKRKDPSDELNFDNIYGFILNIPSDCRLGWLALPIKRKHWVAIRNLPSVTEKDSGRSNYYNLDSKFDKPESIGVTDNLIEYLRGELKSPEKELFLVVTEDIGRLETWRKNPPPPPPQSAIASSSFSAASGATHLLPVPGDGGGPDASAGSGNGNFRRTSNDSGVVDLLPDLRDINVVDLNKEDLMRRQSSGVWSDLT